VGIPGCGKDWVGVWVSKEVQSATLSLDEVKDRIIYLKINRICRAFPCCMVFLSAGRVRILLSHYLFALAHLHRCQFRTSTPFCILIHLCENFNSVGFHASCSHRRFPKRHGRCLPGARHVQVLSYALAMEKNALNLSPKAKIPGSGNSEAILGGVHEMARV
jgi:hypothetical protein